MSDNMEKAVEKLVKEIDVNTQKRILRFLNAARTPKDLIYLPDPEDFVHEWAERPPVLNKRKPIMSEAEARKVITYRHQVSPIFGFIHFRDLLFFDWIIRLIRELFCLFFGYGRYGRWQTLYDMKIDGEAETIEGEHAALLHTYKVLFLPGDSNTYLWDVSDISTPTFTRRDSAATGLTESLMCGGHSFLSDGKLLVAAGKYANPRAWKFDPITETWARTAGDMAISRWYPTLVTLGDESGPTGQSGRVLVTSGVYNSNPQSNITPPPVEVYSEASDTFEPVTVSGVGKKFFQTYPGLHLLPDGNIFYAANGFGSCGTGAVYPLDEPASIFNFSDTNAGAWSDLGANMNRTKGMSVLVFNPMTYPFVRAFVFGGGDVQSQKTVRGVNLSDTNPNWDTEHAFPDGRGRVNPNVVLLPDNTIFVSGGLQGTEGGTAIAQNCWIFDPAKLDNPWREMDELETPRHYHSVSILLPSGQVMVAGGSADGGCGMSSRNNVEVFSPPYLFNADCTPATRPRIRKVNGVEPTPDVSPTIHHGSPFTVDTPDACDINRVVLVRPMAVTHQTDTEQRVIPCTFSQTGANEVTAVAPNGSHPHAMAPRGYYMLFILNNRGTPSEGKFVHLH